MFISAFSKLQSRYSSKSPVNFLSRFICHISPHARVVVFGNGRYPYHNFFFCKAFLTKKQKRLRVLCTFSEQILCPQPNLRMPMNRHPQIVHIKHKTPKAISNCGFQSIAHTLAGSGQSHDGFQGRAMTGFRAEPWQVSGQSHEGGLWIDFGL